MEETWEILEQLNVGVMIFREDIIVYANSSMKALFPSGVVLGASPSRLLNLSALEIGRRGTLSHNGTSFTLEIVAIRPCRYQGTEASIMEVQEVSNLKRLEDEVVKVSNEERQRLARELHDGIAGEVAAIAFRAQALQQKLVKGSPEDAEAAQEIVQSLSEAGEHIRNLSHNLDPNVERQSLAQLLAKIAKNCRQALGASCICRVHGEPPPGAAIVLNLHRIAQEAVNNACRHGAAKAVEILFTNEGTHFSLRITDNGHGMIGTRSGSGIGLRSMEQRAMQLGGSLKIAELEGGGTLVECLVPL